MEAELKWRGGKVQAHVNWCYYDPYENGDKCPRKQEQ